MRALAEGGRIPPAAQRSVQAHCGCQNRTLRFVLGHLRGNGPLVSAAVRRGDMYPTSLVASTPVSLQRREVSLNTTRLSGVDATRTDQLSGALGELMDPVWMCATFLKKSVPGYANANFAGIAPRIGIRETRRIIGEKVLGYEDVMEARKREDGIAKGAHHVDVHGAGDSQLRQPIRDGGSYDIPFGCLIPKGLNNVFIAGRCFSATREAHGSARVMGTCMAMGQAVGIAAAIMVESGDITDVRNVDVDRLRDALQSQGAILQGTH